MRAQRGRLIVMFAPAGVLATVIVAAVAPLLLGVAFAGGVALFVRGRSVHDRRVTPPPPEIRARIEPRTVTVRHFGAPADRYQAR